MFPGSFRRVLACDTENRVGGLYTHSFLSILGELSTGSLRDIKNINVIKGVLSFVSNAVTFACNLSSFSHILSPTTKLLRVPNVVIQALTLACLQSRVTAGRVNSSSQEWHCCFRHQKLHTLPLCMSMSPYQKQALLSQPSLHSLPHLGHLCGTPSLPGKPLIELCCMVRFCGTPWPQYSLAPWALNHCTKYKGNATQRAGLLYSWD